MEGEVKDNNSHVSNKFLLAILGVLIIAIVGLVAGIVITRTQSNLEQVATNGGNNSNNGNSGGNGNGGTEGNNSGNGDSGNNGSGNGGSSSGGDSDMELDEYGWPVNEEEEKVVAYDNMSDEQKEAYDYVESTLHDVTLSRYNAVQMVEGFGYSHEDALTAVDSYGFDYDKNAAENALRYLSYLDDTSRENIIDHLRQEGFTQEQAENGVEQSGIYR